MAIKTIDKDLNIESYIKLSSVIFIWNILYRMWNWKRFKN